jgi:translocation and assembly module TamB
MDVMVRATGLDLATLDLAAHGIRLAGSLDAEVRARGVVTQPRLDGALTFAGVRFRAEGVPGIDKLAGKIVFDREEVRIERLAGTLGRGPFQVSGTVAIRDGRPGAADLRIVADNAQLLRSEGVRMRTDLDLTVKGTGQKDLTVSGQVTLQSLKVGATGLLAAQDIETILAGIRSSPALATLPLTTDPALKDIRLDLTLLIPEGAVHVRTNLVKATANGRLLVGGTLAVPRPRGRIYVPEGTVFLIAGRLELEKPVITFKEGEPLVPWIDGRATARVSGVEIFVDVSGSASNAKVLLSSVPPHSAPDIVSLILTGATRENLGSDALSGMASAYVLRQLSSSFSEDDEDSVLSDLVSRIEVEFDDRKTGSGGIPGFTATARILDWLFVRGRQESALDYGFDLIFRLTFP